MNSDVRLSNLKNHCEFLANPKLNGRVPGHEGNRLARNYIQQQFEAKVIPAESVDTIELEARYLSAMTGQVIAPHRPTLDALVSEIKSTYLGRSD
jgi:hypothetical protein